MAVLSGPDSGSTQLFPAVHANLVIRYADGVSQTLALSKDTLTIGRHPTNDIVVSIPTVSVEHALIEAQMIEGRRVYRLVDRGSRNGTFVNGRRVSTHTLLNGDIIRIGDALGNSVSLTFQAGRVIDAVSLGQFQLGETESLTIGRDPANDLHLNSPLVSRRHARVARIERGHTLIDLGSTHGTYVKDRPPPPHLNPPRQASCTWRCC